MITRQDHSDEEGPRLGWDIILCPRVWTQISRLKARHRQDCDAVAPVAQVGSNHLGQFPQEGKDFLQCCLQRRSLGGIFPSLPERRDTPQWYLISPEVAKPPGGGMVSRPFKKVHFIAPVTNNHWEEKKKLTQGLRTLFITVKPTSCSFQISLIFTSIRNLRFLYLSSQAEGWYKEKTEINSLSYYMPAKKGKSLSLPSRD